MEIDKSSVRLFFNLEAKIAFVEFKSGEKSVELKPQDNALFLFEADIPVKTYSCVLIADGKKTDFELKEAFFSLKPNSVAMSFNVRYDTFWDCSFKSWNFRNNLVVKTILKHSPSFISLQETDLNQRKFLEKELFPVYSHFGIPRDGRSEEGNGILYRNDLFTLETGGNFALSETPEKIGSSSWGEGNRRICTWATLKSVQTGKLFHVYSIHLDYASQLSRSNSIKLVKEKIKEHHGTFDRSVVVGDFNALPGAKEFAPLAEDFLQMGESVSDATFHDFVGKELEKIDFFFVGNEIEAGDYQVIKDSFDEIYPSDHYPITCELN